MPFPFSSLIDRVCAIALALSRMPVFLSAIALYYAVAWVVRVSLLGGSSGDEAQLMLYGQGWALGYDFGNPPLAGWLSALAETLFGPTLGAAIAIRYGLLVLFFAAMLAAAREAIEDRRLAAAAALSPVAFWFVGWASLTVYMDSLVLIVALAAMVWLMLRAARAPTTAVYAGLAPVMAAGLLGKFSFAPAAALLVLAAFAVPMMRAVVLDRRFWFAVVAAVALAAPAYGYVLWSIDTWLQVAEARILDGAVADTPPDGAGARALLALKAAFDFSLPLLPVFVLMFATALVQARTGPIPPARRALALWLGLWVGLVLAAFALAMVAAEIDKLREHYLFVLVPLPILLFALVPADAVGARRVGGYLAVLILLAGAAIAALTAQAVVDPLNCTKCRLVMPWRDYAERLREAGFDRGTIISFDSPSTDAGPNLRRFLTESRVWTTKRPFYIPPALDLPGGCVVIWNDSRYPETLDHLRTAPIAEIGGPLPADAVIGRLEADLPLSGRAAPVLGYAFFAGGIGTCR